MCKKRNVAMCSWLEELEHLQLSSKHPVLRNSCLRASHAMARSYRARNGQSHTRATLSSGMRARAFRQFSNEPHQVRLPSVSF
mmetsp:Transcript_107079/g.190259  ORF Transcript_107079/g.190259 Transcript_107079/m.190259 type:complete len:83 (-) Transcript_107079:1231-1479(-)